MNCGRGRINRRLRSRTFSQKISANSVVIAT
jgi:hypothetical protein